MVCFVYTMLAPTNIYNCTQFFFEKTHHKKSEGKWTVPWAWGLKKEKRKQWHTGICPDTVSPQPQVKGEVVMHHQVGQR